MDYRVVSMIMPIFWILAWATIFITVWYLKGKRREKMMEIVHQERMIAMEKGIPLPELPELPQLDPDNKDTIRQSLWSSIRANPKAPLGIGAIAICLGIGWMVACYFSGDPSIYQNASMGIIAVFFGFGLFMHYALTKSSRS